MREPMQARTKSFASFLNFAEGRTFFFGPVCVCVSSVGVCVWLYDRERERERERERAQTPSRSNAAIRTRYGAAPPSANTAS